MNLFQKIKSGFQILRKQGFVAFIDLAWLKILYIMPLKNIMVFECESDMDDNPRALYEYMINNSYNRKIKLVWLVNDTEFCKKTFRKKNVVFINRHDKAFFNRSVLNYYLNIAKWLIFSHPYWFYKNKENQTVIHIGHGTPIKQSSKCFDSTCFDWMPIPSESVVNWYTQFWCCDASKTFICGLPRNDLLKNGSSVKESIYKKMNWDFVDAKTIMCMPTFRQSKNRDDSSEIDEYSLGVVENDQQFYELNQYLHSNNIHLIVKIHPLQKIECLKPIKASNIHYVQNRDLLYNNVMLYELIGCCDALVKDVSSVVFDFLLVNRPVAFFMNNYLGYSRGYLLDDPTEFMPGKKILTFEELKEFLDDLHSNIDKYESARIAVNEYVNGKKQYCYCEELLKWLDIQL
ncbi:MAG: CDP-glycerol glycerophosphotransferase family protein [Clostridia bacterium]|nr:CDP-glycerol glycerophosphotransferase family protein [Clostridia bacterium]